jgi:UPF0716 family protein affecting phage T7 exclusion
VLTTAVSIFAAIALLMPGFIIALSAYTALVLLFAPILLGLALKTYLGRAELRDGPPGRLAASLGAGEARDAFDYAFQRRRAQGA